MLQRDPIHSILGFSVPFRESCSRGLERDPLSCVDRTARNVPVDRIRKVVSALVSSGEPHGFVSAGGKCLG